MATINLASDILKKVNTGILNGFADGAQIVRNLAVLNVTGRVLKRDTGRLATSITTRVTGGVGAKAAVLAVGTRVKYGKYWEEGFPAHYVYPKTVMSKKNPKYFAALRFKPKGGNVFVFRRRVLIPAGHRPWLRPAAEAALPLITARVQKRIAEQFGGQSPVVIDLKIS